MTVKYLRPWTYRKLKPKGEERLKIHPSHVQDERRHRIGQSQSPSAHMNREMCRSWWTKLIGISFSLLKKMKNYYEHLTIANKPVHPRTHVKENNEKEEEEEDDDSFTWLLSKGRICLTCRWMQLFISKQTLFRLPVGASILKVCRHHTIDTVPSYLLFSIG